MKHPVLQASIVALVGATAITGCGGSDGGGDGEFARFTAQDVQQRFRELAGVELEIRRGIGDSTSLSLPTGQGVEDLARARLGGVDITVAEDEDALERRREISVGSSETAVVGNVLVRSAFRDEKEGFARALRIVRTLGKPASSVRLPPEDTPCEKAGIDPDGGDTKTGTCLDGQQIVTVVGPRDTLELPSATVTRTTQRVSRELVDRRYGTTRRTRAQGQFVTVRARVENTADAPLDRLPADLVINGRRYASDDANAFQLQEERPFPIQPGGTKTLTFLFDIPRTADDPGTGGALQFSTDARVTSTPDRVATIGRIRLPR